MENRKVSDSHFGSPGSAHNNQITLNQHSNGDVNHQYLNDKHHLPETVLLNPESSNGNDNVITSTPIAPANQHDDVVIVDKNKRKLPIHRRLFRRSNVNQSTKQQRKNLKNNQLNYMTDQMNNNNQNINLAQLKNQNVNGTANANCNNNQETIIGIDTIDNIHGFEKENNLVSLFEEKHESRLSFSLKLFAIFSTLYFFMWSSSLLSEAFKLTSVHYTGHFFRTTDILKNPLLGLMVGIGTTVIVQSSGAITSVLVTMVGSGVLTVRQGIPIIMGANVGTSVTNTIVSLVEYGNKQNFGIAITAGIVHDMQNVMTVIFMLPLELLVHFLERSSDWCVQIIGLDTHTEVGELQFLSCLVKPLVDLIIMVDTKKMDMIAPDTLIDSSVSLIKRCCKEEKSPTNETLCLEKCTSLFSHIDLNDNSVSLILVVIALITLFTCLIFVVRTTQSMLGGKFINWISALAKRKYEWPYSMLVGYLFIFVGMILTIILHSSGVFTSMLVPLAGGNVLNLMQIYELTLGSNVGTTTTGIIAALSAQSRFPRETLQVALCHCIFNIAGIVMFYAFPYTKLPLWASKQFGLLSVKNRWFSISYLLIVFIILPAVTLALYFAFN